MLPLIYYNKISKMAISVDTVYKTVLLILNKEQRGYMTPDEFNKVATQVQLEMFESYFDDLNQQLRVPDNDSEYADRIKNLDTKLSIFKAINNCNYMGTNEFATPLSSSPPLCNGKAAIMPPVAVADKATTAPTSPTTSSSSYPRTGKDPPPPARSGWASRCWWAPRPARRPGCRGGRTGMVASLQAALALGRAARPG